MLIGRRSERAAIGALVAGAVRGQGGALVVEGDPGMGKTVLLDEAVASAPNLTVLRASGLESSTGLPFIGLAELIRPVESRIDALPRPQAETLRRALALEEAGAVVDHLAVGVATLGLLACCLERTGDSVAASNAFLQALAGDPLNTDWKEGLLRVYVDTRQFGPAEVMARGLIKLRPTETRYWLAYANILLSSHRKGEALVLLEAAAARTVDPAHVYFGIGAEETDAGRRREAAHLPGDSAFKPPAQFLDMVDDLRRLVDALGVGATVFRDEYHATVPALVLTHGLRHLFERRGS